MEERKSWEQQEDEPTLWYGRFREFLRMGTKRSVGAVFKKEGNSKELGKTRKTLEPDGTWYAKAREWKWEERARKWDEHQRAEEDKAIAEEKDRVLRSGFALMHKRVKELDRLSRKLIRMTGDESKVWLSETKTSVFGEDRSQTIEKVTFNHQLFQLIDKYLDSIAKEVGERVKKQELDVTTNGETQSLHEAIEKALEQFPDARSALAEKLAEIGQELDQ